MKTTKLTIAGIALFIALAFSNTAASQTPFFQIGYTQPTFTTTTNILGVNILNTQKFDGIQAGFGLSVPDKDPLGLRWSLLYSYLFNNTSNGGENTLTEAHTLNFPLDLVFAIPMPDGLRVEAFGGPDFSYFLSQRVKVGNDQPYSEFENNSDLQRFMVQLGVGAGIGYNDFLIKFRYNWGLTDQNSSDNVTKKANGFSISMSHSF